MAPLSSSFPEIDQILSALNEKHTKITEITENLRLVPEEDQKTSKLWAKFGKDCRRYEILLEALTAARFAVKKYHAQEKKLFKKGHGDLVGVYDEVRQSTASKPYTTSESTTELS